MTIPTSKEVYITRRSDKITHTAYGYRYTADGWDDAERVLYTCHARTAADALSLERRNGMPTHGDEDVTRITDVYGHVVWSVRHDKR